jgi:hypothetical protein
MPISFQNSRDKLLKSFLDSLWRQWSALGVAGHPDRGDPRIIDPEALLLATTRFGRYDPRLLDGAIDWLATHGKRINLQRLRRLHDDWPMADLRVLAAISGGLAAQSVLRKWGALSGPLPAEAGLEPLFIGFDGRPLPVLHEPDPKFLHHGLLRDPVERRHMSRPPDPGRPANLLLCMRALFGVNSRAEIMAWLLTHGSGHPAAIARDTGYHDKSVQHTLNEMEDSGHVRSRRDGREKIFWLNAGEWKFLAHPTPDSARPLWVDWMPLFSAISTFITAIGESGLDDFPEQVQSIRLRKALDDAMPALSRAGLVETMSASRKLTGKELISAIHADLGKLEAML